MAPLLGAGLAPSRKPLPTGNGGGMASSAPSNGNDMRTLAIALFLTGASLGQTPLKLTIDPSVSVGSWSGSTNLGPLVGNPAQDFTLRGSFLLILSEGVHPISQGRFVGGNPASVAPHLSGQIPNPVPGLPPLAILDVTDLAIGFSSPQFTIDGTGSFTGYVVCTALSGLLTVTPLAGAPTTTDLTGTTGDPTPFSGTVVQNGQKIYADASQASSINFTDPGSGVTGSLRLAGRLFGAWFAPTPVNYCSAELNSTGEAGAISHGGSVLLQENTFKVTAEQLPQEAFSYFIMSPSQGFVPGAGGSQGNLCLGLPQVRFSSSVLNSGRTGSVGLQLDLQNLPLGTTFHPGDEWNFQLWYRDRNPRATSNFTDGLTVVFAP